MTVKPQLVHVTLLPGEKAPVRRYDVAYRAHGKHRHDEKSLRDRRALDKNGRGPVVACSSASREQLHEIALGVGEICQSPLGHTRIWHRRKARCGTKREQAIIRRTEVAH